MKEVSKVLRQTGRRTVTISLFHPIPTPKSGQIRVACVGDSITYGYRVQGRRRNSYPSQLEKLLGDGYCVGNFGYSGCTAQKNGDHPYTDRKLYRQSLAWKPDLVLLMLGTNDSKPYNWSAAAYARDMEQLIDAYKAAGSRICLLTPLPAFPVNGAVKFDISSEVLESEVLPICHALSQRKDVQLIDVRGSFEGRPDLFADGVHPNRLGAEVLAGSISRTAAGADPLRFPVRQRCEKGEKK